MNNNGSNKHFIDCVGCKQRISFTMPKWNVTNAPTFSSGVAVHEQLSKCPHCGQAYSFYVKALQTAWELQPISEEDRRQIEGSNIISLRP